MALQDALYGTAVGDALGVPFEFRKRGTFEAPNHMVGHGTHDRPAGTFSDDTSMTLACADSLRAKKGRVDLADMRKRFCNWRYDGAYTPDKIVFDVGGTTSTALEEGHGETHEWSNGNGSLMRIVPMAYVNASDEQIREVSAITHGHPLSMDLCVRFVHAARDLEADASIAEVCEAYAPGVASRDKSEVPSSGFVKDTYEAAFWCLANTDSYEDAVKLAVSLGSDTDTTAAVTGALAGIAYGTDCIPSDWMADLRGKEVIEACLF